MSLIFLGYVLHGYLAFGMQILELVEVSLHVEPVRRDDVRPVRRKFQKLKYVIHTAVSSLPHCPGWQAEWLVVSGFGHKCVPPLSPAG
jgi:hypothetical protein